MVDVREGDIAEWLPVKYTSENNIAARSRIGVWCA